MSRAARYTVVLAALLLAGCGRNAGGEYAPTYGDRPPASDTASEGAAEYVFAVHPLHNPTRLFEVYQPLVEFINARTKAFSLRLEASKDYAAFEEKLAQKRVHFALPNPYQTVRSEKQGYRIFAKMGDDQRFRGIILVRRDSGIRQVRDLKKAAISFPAPTAVAAAMMPKYFLKTHGLDVEREAAPRYVGSQESSIMNVYQRQTRAGCTWPPPWESFAREKPEIARDLVVKWQTEPLVNNGLVVRADVPEAHVRIVRDALLGLHEHAAGRRILARMNLSRYEAADSATYEPVRVFLKKYAQAFGAVPSGKVQR